MVMSDTRIRELIDSGVLRNALPDNVGPVSYDLVTKTFCTQEGETARVELAPGDSVFVACRELIELPADMTAEVKLRNSRIRQGLSLEAPLYFPGHHTRVFYRVTNSSADAITLDTSHGIAQLVFSTVEGPVEHPYDGVFSDELNYRDRALPVDIVIVPPQHHFPQDDNRTACTEGRPTGQDGASAYRTTRRDGG